MKTLTTSNLTLLTLSLLLLLNACSKNSGSSGNPAPVVLKHWDITMNSKFEVPAPAGRSETGTVALDLYSDMTIRYTINVTGLTSGDALTAAHIHVGDPITSGGVILGFSPSFNSGSATGQVNLRVSLADSLKNGSADFYVNVHSTQVPAGLLRGQLNNPVVFAMDVAMTGSAEVPAVNTTTTGVALLRLTADKTLYAKINVTGLESGDVLTASHIHAAAAGVNGTVIVPICASAADFGVALKIPAIADANVSLIQTGQVYVNVHSQNHASGLIRGQIR